MFPNSNLRTAKRRPALVVQANNLNTGLSQVILAMISSNMQRTSHPSRVEVRLSSPEARQTGLLTNSVMMTDNLATVLEAEIDRKLGILPSMAVVGAALCHTLGIEKC
ncbi:transcriptional regulator [filamentous cyanobacterium CCT1]|nr:transcriptional regulator [filamentous cyanobacterium CCT1]PSN76692.1 transcriptional regulator [filamentous cyanobacterium CCP4]